MIAEQLLHKHPESIDEISRHLVDMCQAYAEIVQLAGANHYLWGNAAAPVDVGDIDIAGVTALATQRLGLSAVERMIQSLAEGTQLSDVALAPMRAGLVLAEPQLSESGSEWW